MERTGNSDRTFFLILLLLAIPLAVAAENTTVTPAVPAGAPYTITIFIPTQEMIHSDQINDLISGPENETLIGTSFGLSVYNGSWRTWHLNLNNISEGLMDDYVTALEMDGSGNIWIGYSSGIQIYDGKAFRAIRDQQLLKETRIKDLQRWNTDMWIATGHAGMHRYRNGSWTWYQPMTRSGPGFYEVRSMGLDYPGNTLVIATETEGMWTLQVPGDKPAFREISPRYGTYGFLERVVMDPRGGVYLSNRSLIVHYDAARGFVPVLEDMDLEASGIVINDIAAAYDGRLFIATDNGIYIWKDGGIIGHLGRFEGLGTSPAVRTVWVDAKNRVWYSSPGYVGFYADQAASTIPVELVTLVPAVHTTPSPVPVPQTTPVPTPTATIVEAPFFSDDSFLKFLNPIVDPIAKALRSLGSGT